MDKKWMILFSVFSVCTLIISAISCTLIILNEKTHTKINSESILAEKKEYLHGSILYGSEGSSVLPTQLPLPLRSVRRFRVGILAMRDRVPVFRRTFFGMKSATVLFDAVSVVLFCRPSQTNRVALFCLYRKAFFLPVSEESGNHESIDQRRMYRIAAKEI